jgi:pimeloyl-ACP methyl ester carboxylesterase
MAAAEPSRDCDRRGDSDMLNRRLLLGLMSAAVMAPGGALSQQSGQPVLKRARTPTLEIAYEDSGPEAGVPVLLMHGFPYDPRCYDEVVPPLVAAGYRAIVPYLRGYGPTRFLRPDTPRSGQQAAMGRDILDVMDALNLPSAALVGFDWGGRGACVVAALWPERVRCLVVANGYGIQDIAGSVHPAAPAQEHRMWYQYYFHTERGRAGLAANRREFCKLLWQLWSPNWKFDDATYERTAVSFDNPDFVDVVIQSYRHRFGYAPGDPALEGIEQRLAARPPITVPTIVLQGEGDGVAAATRTDTQAHLFTGPYQRRLIAVIGHDVPQEAPKEVAAAVLELLAGVPPAPPARR